MATQYPVGMPFMAKVDFTAPKGSGQLSLRKGDYGKIAQISQSGWYGVIKITADGQQNGWIPPAAVTIGTKKWGDHTIKTDFEQISPTPSGLQSTEPDALAQYLASALSMTTHDKIVWVLTKIDKVVENYRRPFTTVKARSGEKDAKSLLLWAKSQVETGEKRENFELTIDSKGPGPKAGDQISVIFEISLNGPHPQSYARLPTLGPHSDWDIARSLAIRVEWHAKHEGHKLIYIQATKHDLVNKEAPGSVRAYAEAIGLYHYLKQETVTNRPSWMPNFGLASLRETTFDVLSQEFRLNKVQPRANPNIPMASRKPFNVWRNELKAIGVDKVGGKWGSVPGTASETTTTRDKCDVHVLCSVKNVSTGGAETEKCEEIGTTGRCQLCANYDRPSTWSNNITGTAKDQAIWDATAPAPKSGGAAQQIEDPGVMELMSSGEDAEDAD